MTEFEILSLLSSNYGSMTYLDVLNLYPKDLLGCERLVKSMLAAQLIVGETTATGEIKISPSGQALLCRLQKEKEEKEKDAALSQKLKEETRQQHAKERAEDAREKRKDRIAQFFASVVGSFLGAFFAALFGFLFK